MRNRVVAALLFVGVSLGLYCAVPGLGTDEDVAELMRQARRARQDRDVAGSSADVAMIRLTETLVAELNDRDWVVRDEKEPGFLVFPFRPKASGEFPTHGDTSPDYHRTNPGFVGPNACASCHPQKHAGVMRTAHGLTSRHASKESVAGTHASSKRLNVPDSSLQFTAEVEGEVPTQHVSFAGWETQIPMDISIGSGKNGQSYLFWVGDALYQNHLSFLSASNAWIHSPGYPVHGGMYGREVGEGCLECHVTFVQRSKRPNHYFRDSAILGVTCERCHGPGREHVEYHQQNPETREPEFVSDPGKLSRQAQLEICGQCHSGSFKLRSRAFAFRPGDMVAEHHQSLHEMDGVGTIHTSNQLTRLQRSKCFQLSEMTCTTCHDPHRHERGALDSFSARCLNCHSEQACKMQASLGEQLSKDCISCHMPTVANQRMDISTTNGQFSPPMIDHHIRVDSQATRDFLKTKVRGEPTPD
ncbi:MAG: multiheme c-type cytochrome [Planctomycetota bacterium]